MIVSENVFRENVLKKSGTKFSFLFHEKRVKIHSNNNKTVNTGRFIVMDKFHTVTFPKLYILLKCLCWVESTFGAAIAATIGC